MAHIFSFIFSRRREYVRNMGNIGKFKINNILIYIIRLQKNPTKKIVWVLLTLCCDQC